MGLKSPQHGHGMALVEIIMSAMLVTLMVIWMVPAALRLVDEAREGKTNTELKEIQDRIDAFHKTHSRFPISLTEIYETVPVDPWGNPYQYLNLAEGLHKTRGRARKYKGMQFINKDYDLYSMGPDGKSVPSLAGEPGRDDIIRAYNGRYLGPVLEFEP